MANQTLGLGSVANDDTGDTLRVASDKINDNFLEIYTLIGDASSLSTGISATASVITLSTPTIVTPNITGTAVMADLDISGDVDVDGTLEADAITVAGVTLATFVRDTVGTNMLSSNTESGITVTYDTTNDNIDFAINAAQTGITSILATDLIIGEDAQTAIDFGTANEIDFKVDNANRLTLTSAALIPATNNQIDLGTASLEFKDAFFDGTVTSDAFAGPLTGEVTGNASTATTLATARTIGGTSFNGSANIAVALSATTTALATARTIGGTSFDGTANIAVGLSATATALATARTIGGTSFDGTGNIAVALASVGTAITVADESSDTTCFPLFATGATGDLGAKSGSNLTFNSSTGLLTATLLAGALTGNVTGNASGTAATVTGAAQTAITSVGTLTALQVDNININLNTISSTAGTDLLITPLSGQQIVLDGAIVIDAGVVTGATSITSTAFVGALTGNASGTAATVTGAAQTAITSVGTLTALQVDNLNINGNTLSSTAGTDLLITPLGGQQIVLDGAIIIDAGVVTGATSITSTAFVGALTGNVTGNASGTAATVTGAAQTNITSVGTLTALQIDNLNLNGNTLSSTAGTDLLITPLSGQQIVLDGAIIIDAGVVTGATSVTSTAFVGDITGDVTGTADIATAVTVADESSDTTCFPLFATAATGDLPPKSGTNLTFNSSSGLLTATGLAAATVGASGLSSLDGGINTNDDFTVDADGNVVGVAATFSGLTNLTGSFSQAIHTFVATDAITSAEHAGRVLLLGEVGGNADVVLTLPDATGTGHVYKFIVTVTMGSNTYKIQCPDADNVINGTIKNMDLDGTAQTIFGTASTSDTITLNGGTQGGQVSDTLTLIDIAANLWHVEGQMRTPTGANPATPFSAAVS